MPTWCAVQWKPEDWRQAYLWRFHQAWLKAVGTFCAVASRAMDSVAGSGSKAAEHWECEHFRAFSLASHAVDPFNSWLNHSADFHRRIGTKVEPRFLPALIAWWKGEHLQQHLCSWAIYLSDHLPIYLPVYPSVYLSIYLSIYLSNYESFCLSICLCLHLVSVVLSIWLSDYLSIYLIYTILNYTILSYTILYYTNTILYYTILSTYLRTNLPIYLSIYLPIQI